MRTSAAQVFYLVKDFGPMRYIRVSAVVRHDPRIYQAGKCRQVSLVVPWLQSMVEAAVDMTASAASDGADHYAQQVLAFRV